MTKDCIQSIVFDKECNIHLLFMISSFLFECLDSDNSLHCIVSKLLILIEPCGKGFLLIGSLDHLQPVLSLNFKRPAWKKGLE